MMSEPDEPYIDRLKDFFNSPEENFHETIYDFFPGIIYVYHPETKKLRYVNKGITDLLGFTKDDIKAFEDDFTKIVHQDDLAHVQKELEKFSELKDNDSYAYRCRCNRKQGDWVHFNIRGKVLRRDATGKAAAVLLLAQDITDQVAAEEDRRRSRELEQRNIEIDRSNKELEDFAYAASHDLQEPLRKIATLGDGLQKKFGHVLNEEGIKYVERIKVATKNARLLIDSLMEFSRITRESLSFAETNLTVVLEDVKVDLELRIQETSTTIHAGDLPTLEISSLQVKQLFSNIILNSIKFCVKDVHPRIDIASRILSTAEIESFHLDTQRRYFIITIQDNGIGFEEAYDQQIFQMFHRLNGKSEYPGAGIGLALCKKIVEHHKGRIFAKGTPDLGALFTIILPEKHF